jgi:hypothetical protein
VKREAKLSTKLLPLLWEEERFAQHTNLLLRLMVHFGLALPIRGKEKLIVVPLLAFNGSKPPIVHEPQGALHFLLHFAHHVPIESVSRRTQAPTPLWTEEELKQGFLPVGMLHQLCVACVGWSFRTAIGFEPSLGKGHAFVRFGRHPLLLSRIEGQPQVKAQLYIDGKDGGALEVLDRVRLLLPHALRHFPNLRCSLLIPLKDGWYADHKELKFLKKETVVVNKKELASAEKTALLLLWLCSWSELKTNADSHAFVSYRWTDAKTPGGDDSALADALADTLSTQEVHGQPMFVFQDKRRLHDGDRFDLAFMSAMLNSFVIVPLVSWDALKRMTSLTEGSPCDNVLLEWSLALELSDRFATKKILPILLGSPLMDDKGNVSMADLFTEIPLRSDIRH